MTDSFLPAVEGHRFQITGDWVIENGERGYPPLARVAEILGAGLLVERSRTGAHRNGEVLWRSDLGACLWLSIHPFFSDAQSYDYVLALPDGTAIRFDLVDACSASQLSFLVREGATPFARVAQVIREVFASF
jgi:hypothetical protein